MRKTAKEKWKIAAGTGGFFVLAGTVYILILGLSIPDMESIERSKIAESTKIYDRSGKILLYELHGEEKRTIIPFESIPDIVKKATIAVEDRNFYLHAAIDWRSLVRAFVVNIMNVGIVQGGSTITQQLAKNAFLDPDRTITRKIREVFLSYRLENKYSKDEILALYLNRIPYGSNAYGIEAAAETFFNKEAKALNVTETAFLVGLPKAPSYYSPWGSHLKEALARKDQTLGQMRDAGIITEEERMNAEKEVLEFAPKLSAIKAPHFVMMVQEYLVEKYGDDLMRTGGLRVKTTLDGDLQEKAEKAVAEGAARNEKLYKGKNAALVAEDTKTGQILAFVGARDYFDKSIDGNFNVAAHGLRQPGSSIKPFAYYTGFTKGLSPDTILFDAETEFDTTGDPERSYKPHNFDNIFRGPIPLRSALAQSINVTAVKTVYIAGIANVIKAAHDMGITTLNEKNRYGLSLALGGGEVTLIDMVAAYSTIAQDGIRHKQAIIMSIEDAKGRVLEKYEDEKSRAAEAESIRLVTDILKDPVARAPLFGGGSTLTSFGSQEVAIKTGTTNDYRDAWTFGYTPSLVVGVWAGNSDNKPLEKNGGSILAAVPIWSAFMHDALKGKPIETFPQAASAIRGKAVLDGSYAPNGEIHSILYFVNKNDLLGDAPTKADSQFENWERGIFSWIEKHPEFRVSTPNGTSSALGVGIDIRTPKNGDFMSSPFTVEAAISGSEDIMRIQTIMNGMVVTDEQIPPSKSYIYRSVVTAPLSTQNKFSIKAYSQKGETTSEIIIFGK